MLVTALCRQDLAGLFMMDFFPHPSGTHSVRPVCSIFPPEDENRGRRTSKSLEVTSMSLEVTSSGVDGTNPESTPLPGVDYSKNQQEVYEEK